MLSEYILLCSYKLYDQTILLKSYLFTIIFNSYTKCVIIMHNYMVIQLLYELPGMNNLQDNAITQVNII